MASFPLNTGGINLPGLIQNAFTILDGLALLDDVVYTPGGTQTYDPVTGTVANTAPTVKFKAAFTRFGETEVDSQVVVTTDSKMLVAAADMQGIEPSHNDTLVSKGIKWKVLRTLGVPTNGFWRIQVRRV